MPSPLDALLLAAGGAVAGALAATNQAPTAVALTNTITGIDENTATASHIKVADIVVVDDGFGTNTLSLTGTDAAFFEIEGTSLYLKAGTVLNYEAKTSYSVAVTADDTSVGATPDAISATYTLAVGNVVDTALEIALVALTGVINGALTPVQHAPTGVVLTNTVGSIDENTATASHIKVADIAVIDDAFGANTLGLTGADAAFFEIVGTSLYLKAGTALDFETKASYAVAVTVDDPDQGGTPDATSATYTLAVADVNEAPTAVVLTNTTVAIDENTATASHVKVADIAVTDDALGTNTLGLTGADAAFFEIDGGALYLKAGTILDFETKASYAVAVTADDTSVGTMPDATSATYTLTVGDVNEATNDATENTGSGARDPTNDNVNTGTEGTHADTDTIAFNTAAADQPSDRAIETHQDAMTAFDLFVFLFDHLFDNGFGTPLVQGSGVAALSSLLVTPAGHMFEFGFGDPFGASDFGQPLVSSPFGADFASSLLMPELPTLASDPFGSGLGTPLVGSVQGDHFFF